MSFKRAIAVGGLSLLAFSIFSALAPQANATPSPALASLIQRTYNPKVTFFHSVEKQSTRGCAQGRTFVTGKDPWINGDRQIEINEYSPIGGDPKRAVLIMPPTGGETVLDQQWANIFCSKGVRAVIVRTFEVLPETGLDLKMYDHEALRSLVAIRQTVDYLTQTGSKSIGLLGTSLGAIQGAFAVVIDDRINVATFICGGMGLAQIAAHTEEPSQKDLRDDRMKAWKMTQAQYDQAINAAVHIDVVPFIDPTLAQRKKVLSIVAFGDTYVPTFNQQRLYEAFGSQQVITLEHDHVESIVRTTLLHATDVFNFFDQNLAKK